MNRIQRIWHNWRGAVFLVALLVLFRSAVADWYVVPTGSMKPTIIEGDRIFVNKLAYDARIPFTHVSLYRFDDPERGDIIVFDSERAGKRMVKRVIGVPGDRVRLEGNRLYINGEPAQYQPIRQSTVDMPGEQYRETLDGRAHRMAIDPHGNVSMQNFGPVLVPDDRYLVLGDNRDQSADSRVFGFVPRDVILGRSSAVVMSLDYDNHFLPRGERFFKGLD